jgi:tRNA(Arg) A34 adenosine deaminase TadA
MSKESDKAFKSRNHTPAINKPIQGKIEKYFNHATQVATKSDYGKIRHGAVLVKGGSVISASCNKDKFSSFASKFRCSHTGPATVHAEIGCVHGVSRSKTSGSTLYVVRINRTGELRLSKPCPMCHEALKYCGIKKVVYSTNSKFAEVYKL